MSIVHFAALLLLSGCAFVSDATVQDIYDADGDGFEHPRWGGDDCNDSDDRAHPDAPERWYDGVDDNCDNQNDFDQDGDGVLAAQGNGQDCNDLDSTVYPGAEELQDGKDNDCDDLVDEAPGTVDVDLDGFTEANGDCDDTDNAINPDAEERWYDGVDQDCDGRSDFDRDLDGYDADSHGGTDCDDTDASIHPNAPDSPLDGTDSDCNGLDF